MKEYIALHVLLQWQLGDVSFGQNIVSRPLPCLPSNDKFGLWGDLMWHRKMHTIKKSKNQKHSYGLKDCIVKKTKIYQ